MGMREWPLPRLYEVLHGEERDRWPPEARFLEAAHNGDVREIKKFTPVSHAIMYGHLPAVRYLLDHGADLHQRRGKITLLHMAVVHGYYEIAKFLLARGANVHAMSELGTPLMDATLRGFPSIVKILLEHKSDVFLLVTNHAIPKV
uniref:Uncharacterized protein n=1 Tax=Aegilops tauschii TaxID=37682 RepID=M8CRS6_AEGTA